jgi:hypothetical protein|tara:strand:- start:1917 stop:2126 length:210 start_codon:yes stop_codon:yes gene_type:complete
MIVEVHYLGNEFVAYDEKGQIIKNRTILEELSFIQPPGYKSVYKVNVDITENDVIINPLDININVKTQR